jgi:UDP-N-acetylmuramyl pentapeptide synthase
MIKKASNYLVFLLLKKIQDNYKKQYGSKLPFIAVFGSVGKSSQTQLIAELFKKADYKVLSTKKNTINGMGMMLADFDMSFETGNILLKKIKFTTKIAKSLFTYNEQLPLKSIIVMEIGFDHQGEVESFRDILTNNLDLAIITALTDEHNQNYSKEFDLASFIKIKSFVPDGLELKLESQQLDSTTKNVIVEMLKPLEYTKSYIIPTDINKLSNSYYININDTIETFTPEFSTKSGLSYLDEILIDNNYLLPPTFAKTLSIVQKVGELYSIDKDIIQDLLGHLTLPNGRFSKFKGKLDTTIIDSSYNSDPDSVLGFLDSVSLTLASQNNVQYDIVKHNIILGEMRELGNIAKEKHAIILDKLIELKKNYSDKIENIILLGSEWDKLNETPIISREGEIKKILYKSQVFNNYSKVYDIAIFFETNIRPQSWFWIKGSQNTIFLEYLVESLLLNKSDKSKLCRQEERWFKMRSEYTS